MLRDDFLEFMNANPMCYFATTENGKPHVRGMLMYRADASGILFHTASTKDLFRQVLENPLVEVCFVSPDGHLQIRVSGKAEIVEDLELKKEMIEAREFLKPAVFENGFDVLKIIRMTSCIAHMWTFETNFMPKAYFELTD